MSKIKVFLVLTVLLLSSVMIWSCGRTPSKNSGYYNELGKVMVVEYHRIEDKEGDWIRSRENFKIDLERYYKLGFRLVSIKDVFNNSYINLPAGKKPLIMTFDDASASQFRFQIENGTTVEGRDGYPKIDPNCAIGILDEFYKKHNDFGRAATFYTNSTPFYQKECPELWKLKLQYLVKTGREIGNHTWNHDNLSELSYLEIKKTLGMLQKKIEDAVPSYEASSIALPFGVLPKSGTWLLQKGSYGGTSYNYKVAFLVGSEPTLLPYHKDFIPYLVQRVQACDSELDKWLNKMRNEPRKYFVSDGDANTISVQKEDLDQIDKTALKPGMKIRVCSGEAILKEIKIISKKDRFLKTRACDKGVYYTFHSAGIESRIDSLIKNYKLTGLNTVVLDVKDVEGSIGMNLAVPAAKEIGAMDRIFVRDFPALVARLHKENIRVSARIAVFKDRYLAKHRPDMALKSKTGAVWVENDGINWVDPFNPVTRDYVVSIAEETAKAGVDEIQFDYIRFPEKGHVENIAVPNRMEKYMAIETFLKEALERLEPYNVSIAIDVFGVMAWVKDKDISITGQRMDEMAKLVNVLCPMLYPSHFAPGFDGHANPANEPYLFINDGCKKTMELCKGSDAKIIPWIQGFKWRVPGFNEKYITEQIRGAKDAGIDSYIVWNAGNNYEVTYSALK